MDIRPLKVTVREIVAGHVDDSDREEGIRGYSGRLDIRTKYQRNYIYDNAKRNAVIDTVSKDFPLGLMYWVRNEDGNYEILDGQQATGLVKFRNCAWFTNLDTTKRHEEMVFTRTLAEFEIASAPLHTDEIGSPVYPPARRKLAAHGITCDGKTARLVKRSDYTRWAPHRRRGRRKPL